jgi:hypothetical protein
MENRVSRKVGVGEVGILEFVGERAQVGVIFGELLDEGLQTENFFALLIHLR